MHTFFEWVGEDEFSAGRIFNGEDGFQGMKFSEEILHWVNLPELISEISLYVLLSLCRFNFTRGDVKGNCPG
jgi:hypothetical protein